MTKPLEQRPHFENDTKDMVSDCANASLPQHRALPALRHDQLIARVNDRKPIHRPGQSA
jgi:hypothetical protein